MEKRTIIAFVLSFLILIIWSMVFTQKQKPVPEKVQEELPKETIPAKKDTAPAQEKSPAPLPEAAGPTVAPETHEKDVIVETPLYRAVFSSAGATIKSFQLKKYHVSPDPKSPFVELAQMKENGQDFFGISIDHPSTPQAKEIVYQVDTDTLYLEEASSPRDLIFRGATPDGLAIVQTFKIYPDRYPIDVTVSLSNHTENPVQDGLRASIRSFPPEEKTSYYAFLGIAILLGGKLEEIEPKKMKETMNLSGDIEWMAYQNGHFMAAVIPEGQDKGVFEGKWQQPSGLLVGTYITPLPKLGSRETVRAGYTLYMGPRDLGVLRTLGKNLDRAINFGWTDIIAKPLLYALRFFYKYIHNYGVAIIILTILIKIIFWPLTHKSYKSMKEMQKLQPLMAKIREKYKNNREQMNRELMALYKTYKINPMGGCLPMVIQIPVFFALFRILGNSIELRHAPFIFWINDLSAPDRLFHFPFQIPFMSPPYGLPVLTLFMGASMFIQQKMTPTPGDPAQAKIMMFLPLIFTVMFINFPSGLVLYWLTNNILSIGQQYRIKKGRA